MRQITAAAVALILAASSAQAISIQDWLKKGGGAQKTRKVQRGQTMVAAVRGVEEPGDVDPNAKNFDGVAKMEERKVPKEIFSQFIAEGKLKKK